nr:unnamed protein product [Callosobruchus analis]
MVINEVLNSIPIQVADQFVNMTYSHKHLNRQRVIHRRKKFLTLRMINAPVRQWATAIMLSAYQMIISSFVLRPLGDC